MLVKLVLKIHNKGEKAKADYAIIRGNYLLIIVIESPIFDRHDPHGWQGRWDHASMPLLSFAWYLGAKFAVIFVQGNIVYCWLDSGTTKLDRMDWCWKYGHSDKNKYFEKFIENQGIVLAQECKALAWGPKYIWDRYDKKNWLKLEYYEIIHWLCSIYLNM